MCKCFIVIVTYNGSAYIEKCLDSCSGYDVIVIDNCSTDSTVRIIEESYSNVILIKSEINLGFGKANNLGIRRALDMNADYVFLLNQDAYLTSKVIESLISVHQKYFYGILSPIHLNGKGSKLDRNFSYYMNYDRNSDFYSDYILHNNKKELNLYQVPFVNAAAWLLPKDTLRIIGGFDPLFFHYGEDDNYCQKVLYEGLKIGVVSNTYILHDRENIVKRPSANSEQILAKFEVLKLIKYANVQNQLVYSPSLIKDFLKSAYNFIFKPYHHYLMYTRKKKIEKLSYLKGKKSITNFFNREEYQYL